MNARQSVVGFDFQLYNQNYLALAKQSANGGVGGTNGGPSHTPSPGVNEAEQYEVRIVHAEVAQGQRYWRVIGVRHLSPAENTGKHNLYAELLDEDGKRIHDPSIRLARGWEGQRPDEAAAPVQFDKGDNEPATNVPIESGQHLWVRVDSPLPSDKVENLHTKHADERGPNGEIWNSIGHHSYYVVFQRALAVATVPVDTTTTPTVPVVTPPIVTPPVVVPPVGSAVNDDATYLESGDGVPPLMPVLPDQHFEQIWHLRNSGKNAWGAGYQLVCVQGHTLAAPASVPVPASAPGSDVTLHIPFIAPSIPGSYYSVWRVANAQGQPFGEHLWLLIVVVGARDAISDANGRNVRPVTSPDPASSGQINPNQADPRLPLPPPAVQGALVDPEIYAAWKKHIENGFENNQVMFKQLLEGFMNPYWTTVWMYRILFGLGVASFLVAAGLSAFSDKQGFVLVFGGLSALALLAYFFNRPLQALEENLQFITWLGLIYNSYWTRLVYLNSQKDVQVGLQAATDDAISRIKDLMAAHAAASGKRQSFPQQ